MRTSLSTDKVASLLAPLASPAGEAAAPLPTRAPVHVLYGGAHLFKRDTPDKLGRLALAAFERHAEGSELFASPLVRARVEQKLRTNAVEALTIDFEDGFGPRPDDEEDREAVRAARELAECSPFAPKVGIRVKALAGPTAARATRTLDLFLTALATEGPVRAGFTVTLPKVERPEEVSALAGLLAMLEDAHGLEPGQIGVELMVESPRALWDDEGRLAPFRLAQAADGRCVAMHLGAYDLLSSLGVGAGEQSLAHPACDLARLAMGVALADRGVTVFDGATTTLPIGEADAVRSAWTLHASNVSRALAQGIFQGWDLHPAQLPARYAVLFAQFLERRDALAARLAHFVAQATQATRVGATFDDAATALGLVGFFLRGLSCGAFDADDVAKTTLTVAELRARSFADIVRARSAT